MNYRDEKIILSKNIKAELFNAEISFGVNIVGVRVLLKYGGFEIEKVKFFLSEYLNSFEKCSDNYDVIINYNVLDGKLGDDHWIGWHDWENTIDFDNSDESFNRIIERDFVAKVSKDGKNIYAHGPTWSHTACDPFDNLLIYALGLHLLKHNSFILHAACLSKNNGAYVFFGASGAGKSTIAEISYEKYGTKVMSSDQIIICLDDNNVAWAHITPTTIPEFPLLHPGREKRMLPIKSIIRLTQRSGDYTFTELDLNDWLKFLLKEVICREEFGYKDNLLQVLLKLADNKLIKKGEMSYSKEVNFWEKLNFNNG